MSGVRVGDFEKAGVDAKLRMERLEFDLNETTKALQVQCLQNAFQWRKGRDARQKALVLIKVRRTGQDPVPQTVKGRLRHGQATCLNIGCRQATTPLCHSPRPFGAIRLNKPLDYDVPRFARRFLAGKLESLDVRRDVSRGFHGD